MTPALTKLKCIGTKNGHEQECIHKAHSQQKEHNFSMVLVDFAVLQDSLQFAQCRAVIPSSFLQAVRSTQSRRFVLIQGSTSRKGQ